MGETSDQLKELMTQYAYDMDATFQKYETEKEAIGEELAPEVKAAADEVLVAADKCMEEMKNLSRTFLKNLAELPEGEHPDHDLPETGREPKQ